MQNFRPAAAFQDKTSKWTKRYARPLQYAFVLVSKYEGNIIMPEKIIKEIKTLNNNLFYASHNIDLNHTVLVSEHQVLPPFSTVL